MAFTLREYRKPDFDQQRFMAAPDAAMAPAPADSVAPTGFHAMSIFPEYFKIGGEWLLAEESRMDCVPVYDGSKIQVKEPRRLRKGEQVILGRNATTVLCLATTLHSIAVGNMTPSYRVTPDGQIREVYFYCVDISEFTANKLSDRGSLSAKGIVTNVQDFIVTLSKGLLRK